MRDIKDRLQKYNLRISRYHGHRKIKCDMITGSLKTRRYQVLIARDCALSRARDNLTLLPSRKSHRDNEARKKTIHLFFLVLDP